MITFINHNFDPLDKSVFKNGILVGSITRVKFCEGVLKALK